MKLDLIVSFFLFVTTLLCAWWLDWKATDLVWGLWLSSITVGYVTLIGSPFLIPLRIAEKVPWPEVWPKVSEAFSGQWWRNIPVKKIGLALAILLPVGFFFLAFFTIHFGGFHFIHGSFLSDFFPLDGIKYPNSPWELPRFVLTLLHSYWPFVLASAVSQVARIQPEADTAPKQSLMMQPYMAVIRMHFLIFVFAGLKFLKATNFVFYAVILLAYFFPWRVVRRSSS